MTRSVHLQVGALAAVYLLWLAAWVVIGDEPYGPGRYRWDQAAAAAVTSCFAFRASRRRCRPYPGFLVMQGLAFLLLAGSWLTYPVSSGSSSPVTISVQGASDELADLTSDAFYAACVFTLMCAWGYLALERWHSQPLSRLTAIVFAASMAGLGAIFASFYIQQYGHLINTMLATRRVILYGQKADAWREDLARMISEAIAKVVEDYGVLSESSAVRQSR